MSKKANPALVGAFVLGAIILSIFGVILFGSGSLLEKKFDCVMYFDESIAGLDIGAPVEFQGVRIGTVTDVRIVLDESKDHAIKRPVTIQIEESRINYEGTQETESRRARDDNSGMEMLVAERGLRARLGMQSMLTGKLKIEMGYFPKTKDTRKEKIINEMWVMPTTPTALHNLGKELEELPFKDIVYETHNTIKGLADLIASLETTGAISNLNSTLKGVEELLANINDGVDPLMERSEETMKTLTTTLEDVQGLLGKIDTEVQPFLTSLTETANKTSLMMDEQSPMHSEILRAMTALTKAAQSAQVLTEYLERHPEALLKGKK